MVIFNLFTIFIYFSLLKDQSYSVALAFTHHIGLTLKLQFQNILNATGFIGFTT